MNGSQINASRLYFGAIVALGATVVGLAGLRLIGGGAGYQWLLFASLTILTGSLALKIPGIDSKISVGDTLICINLVLFGTAAGAITAMLDGIFGSLRCATKSRRLAFALFNAASMAVSAGLAGLVFSQVAGRPMPFRGQGAPISTLLPGLALLALAYYLANSIFVATMVALERRQNILTVWREKFIFPIVNYVVAAAVAGLLAQNEGSITALMVLTILAVLAAIYLSSKCYVDAAEAASNHAIGRQWLNSVEMLADAIGVKEGWSREDSAHLHHYVQRLGQAMQRSEKVRSGNGKVMMLDRFTHRAEG